MPSNDYGDEMSSRQPQGETIFDAWARVPEHAKQWLWLNPRMLVPRAVWEDLSAARFGVWGAQRGDHHQLDAETWNFILDSKPDVPDHS